MWAYFFLEKSPEEYAERPYFMVGSTRHFYDGSGTSYRWKRYESRDGDEAGGDEDLMVLCIGINSRLIEEVDL